MRGHPLPLTPYAVAFPASHGQVQLRLDQPLIQSSGADQLRVPALLYHAALVQHHDPVGARHRREPVRDHQHRAVLQQPGEVKSFHPIQDITGKSVDQLRSDLRAWFPPEDRLTDFNAFFDRVATLVKRQNLVLAPVNVLILSDGVPDVPRASASDTLAPFKRLDISPLRTCPAT